MDRVRVMARVRFRANGWTNEYMKGTGNAERERFGVVSSACIQVMQQRAVSWGLVRSPPLEMSV